MNLHRPISLMVRGDGVIGHDTAENVKLSIYLCQMYHIYFQ